MKDTKTVWFSAFKRFIPADYENWLEEMALQGWNIERIGQWSSICMVFNRTGPKRYRYVYDIQTNPKKDYRAMYEQFGWEFVGVMASCFIWRKEYTDERPEAFSDRQSIEERNRRVAGAAAVSFTIFLTGFTVGAVFTGIYFRSLDLEDIIQCAVALVLAVIITCYLGWVVRTIYKRRKN